MTVPSSWPGYAPGPPLAVRRPPTPPDPEAARVARRLYLAGGAVPVVAVAAFLFLGLVVGNDPPTRDAALIGAIAIALGAGPVMVLLALLGIRASRRAGEPAVRAAAAIEVVLGALGTLAGAWVALLLYVQLVAGPFY